MMYKNILVAVDGSSEALVAFNRAMEIAKLDGAKMTVAHVIELTTYLEVNTFQVNITDSMVDYANNLLAEYKEKALDGGVKEVATALEYGDPKAIIPKKIAPDNKVDLIVCGATGLNAVERFFIGSVSENITRRSTCDVLVVRNHDEEVSKDN